MFGEGTDTQQKQNLVEGHKVIEVPTKWPPQTIEAKKPLEMAEDKWVSLG